MRQTHLRGKWGPAAKPLGPLPSRKLVVGVQTARETPPESRPTTKHASPAMRRDTLTGLDDLWAVPCRGFVVLQDALVHIRHTVNDVLVPEGRGQPQSCDAGSSTARWNRDTTTPLRSLGGGLASNALPAAVDSTAFRKRFPRYFPEQLPVTALNTPNNPWTAHCTHTLATNRAQRKPVWMY